MKHRFVIYHGKVNAHNAEGLPVNRTLDVKWEKEFNHRDTERERTEEEAHAAFEAACQYHDEIFDIGEIDLCVEIFMDKEEGWREVAIIESYHLDR
jgi:hypothetical protein